MTEFVTFGALGVIVLIIVLAGRLPQMGERLGQLLKRRQASGKRASAAAIRHESVLAEQWAPACRRLDTILAVLGQIGDALVVESEAMGTKIAGLERQFERESTADRTEAFKALQDSSERQNRRLEMARGLWDEANTLVRILSLSADELALQGHAGRLGLGNKNRACHFAGFQRVRFLVLLVPLDLLCRAENSQTGV